MNEQKRRAWRAKEVGVRNPIGINATKLFRFQKVLRVSTTNLSLCSKKIAETTLTLLTG
jgi:hypothetical protein